MVTGIVVGLLFAAVIVVAALHLHVMVKLEEIATDIKNNLTDEVRASERYVKSEISSVRKLVGAQQAPQTVAAVTTSTLPSK